MNKKHLVDVNDAEARQIVEEELGKAVASFKWFKKGYYSKAALVKLKDGQKVVVKFGNDPIGYKKDLFAVKHFSSPEIPIPEIKLIKQLENSLWLCVSDYFDGVHGDELHGREAQIASPSLQKTLVALHSTPIDFIKGYGEFDENGYAAHSSWLEYLTDDFCPSEFYQDKTIDVHLIQKAWIKIGELARLCPTKRSLVHNDFGSDNLLIKKGRVVAVLDWYFALAGDWAMDVAIMQKYPREVYGDLKAAHQKAGFDCSNWEERINCYRLYSQVGLINWFWERDKQGLKNWQSLNDAQDYLRNGLGRVEAGLMYGIS